MSSYRFMVIAVLALVLVSSALGKVRFPGAVDEEELQEWKAKLIGKKLVSDDVSNFDANTEFRQSDLPSSHRILRPDSMMTMDYRTNRLNVRVNDDDVAESVGFY